MGVRPWRQSLYGRDIEAFRLVQPALIVIAHSQIVERFRVFWRRCQSFFEMLFRFLKAAFLNQKTAISGMHARMVREEMQCLFIVFFGFMHLPGLRQGKGQVIVHKTVIRRFF